MQQIVKIVLVGIFGLSWTSFGENLEGTHLRAGSQASKNENLKHLELIQSESPKLDPYTLSLLEAVLEDPKLAPKHLSDLASSQAGLYLSRLRELAEGKSLQKKTAVAALSSLAVPEPIKIFDFMSPPLNPFAPPILSKAPNFGVATDALYKLAGNKSKDSKIRMQVIGVLVQKEGRNSVPFLSQLLSDPSERPEIRALILASRDQLGKNIFQKEAQENLKNLKQSNPLVRAAVWGLGLNPSPEDLKTLKRISMDSSVPMENRIAAIQGISQSQKALKNYLLDFSNMSPSVRGSEEVVEHLGFLYQIAKDQKLLKNDLIRYFGSLFAGDSFEPHGTGFGRNSRGEFEYIRKHATREQRVLLDAGVKDLFDKQRTLVAKITPRESVQKLVKAMPIWADDQFAESADYFFGKPFIGSWNSAMKHVGFLFLLKAREVSPEAKVISDKLVSYWLETMVRGKNGKNSKAAELTRQKADSDFLQAALTKLGRPDALRKMEESAADPANRHSHGILNSSPIIFIHQYRNLILKEILRGYKNSMNEEQKNIVKKQLEDNEAELTGMLSEFKKGQYTVDEITGFNTYALVTTVLAAKNPSHSLELMRANSHIEWPRYFVDSVHPASPRAGAGRAVPYRLAEIVHTPEKEKQAALKEKLSTAAKNYMTYLPDLMFHSRGRYMHSGEDQIAPYYFHPSVPFEAAALRLLAQDLSFTEKQRAEFNKMRQELAIGLMNSQKSDGTFALPDTKGDAEGGAYPSSAAWVNPLTGLALLSLIDDSKELYTQFGILDPTDFGLGK